MNNWEEQYEPSQEEWDEIEGLIYEEELEEMREFEAERKRELRKFALWCNRNGMLW